MRCIDLEGVVLVGDSRNVGVAATNLQDLRVWQKLTRTTGE